MYTDTQVIEGLVRYIKNEVIPVLPNSAKLLAGAALLHNSGRIGDILRDPKSGDLLRTIGLVSSDGQIDVDSWSSDLKRSMEEFCGGKFELQIPMLSPIIFSTGDVDTLRRYIKGEI